MTESDGEQTARSVALEQAYVHEVYEQCAEKTAQSRHWPRIYKFLEELEPGALVCDIGCGNGKYLSVNNSIFKVGADRCKRLTDIARGKDNEVLICDNLALPFRDESFDAVLSIAVVHHFATTERRVNALKELARVLRIGGKLVISVWAMEQRHRKFESQDVLVPWPKAYCLNSTCNCGTGVPCVNNDIRYNQTTTKSALTSKGSDRQKCRSKSYWIDPIFSPSPSTSSLSSPNETCYSFFRRALQKLAGKRDSANRFLESFHSSNGHQCKGHHQRRQCDSCDDCADVDDIPIELRRLEDDSINITKSNDTLNIKSKSLGDILEIQRLDLVRSRSSIPGLCSTVESQSNLNEKTTSQATSDVYKPRLVKQKTHFNDDSCLEVAENTAIRETINNLPEIRVTQTPMKRTSVVHKQSSMNEELMSMERVIERERVRKNIMKQASLNEEIICKHQTFSNLKDSFSSTAATTRFQLLKSGLTNRIKQSTTSMEKVASISIKNGFVKILQSWTSSDSNPSYEQSEVVSDNAKSKSEKASSVQGLGTPPKREHEIIERRMSKEDGSDSSKDSSLQSDTSVDSEDSFASVIFVPKPEVPPLVDITTSTTTTTCNHKLRTTSAPPSPRVKHPPDLSGPRMKLISISPLLKQFPATSKSLPPPSPPGLSPRTINSVNARPFFGPNYQHNLANSFDKFTSNKSESKGPSGTVLAEQKENNANAEESPVKNTTEPTENSLPLVEKNTVKENDKNLKKKPSLEALRGYKSMTTIVDHEDSSSIEDAVPLLSEIPERSSSESINDSDDSRHSRLNQIKELLKQKPGFATRCTKPTFPLVRRASTATAGRLETVARTLPRLLSLELFNPETDDLDSDSSGVSSPESGDSVISVISDERFILKKTQNDAKPDGTAVEDKVPAMTDTNKSPSVAPVEASQSSRLLEAAANVANSLEDAVGRVIRVKSDSQGSLKDSSMKTLTRYPTEERVHSPTDDATWNEECRRHLIDFTEKLSENLIRDIDQYCQKARLEFVDDGEVQETRNIAKKKSTRNSTKYNELVDNTIAWLRDSTGDFPDCNSIGELDVDVAVDEEVASVSRSASDDTMDFVMVSKSGEIVESVESVTNSCLVNSATDKRSTGAKDKSYMRFGGSCESSDNCESIDNTTSLSTESCNTKRLCSASTASLGSCTNADYKLKNTRKYQYGKRSASEEIAGENHTFDVGNGNFSESSSQDSFPSDRGGGSITYHQYYHVFREGELDQLINKYVENLHIISSYYDHANWCIVAEKVQVWTI